MEEHFILRVPQSVAERLERVLSENPESAGDNLDLSFQGWRFRTENCLFDCLRELLPRLKCLTSATDGVVDHLPVIFAENHGHGLCKGNFTSSLSATPVHEECFGEFGYLWRETLFSRDWHIILEEPAV